MVEEARCGCGRLKGEASYRIHHVGDIRHLYFLCACGQEWTETERIFVDPRDPVGSAEVIDLHERLKREGTLDDLLG